ncbi:MAG: RNA 2',3'-cyclic phosphodiesterase [Solirubrobacterales bacterium]|nr:RNA 2',3'-cyclic phosphodiesterase [Solirubrobacterales bacterium]
MRSALSAWGLAVADAVPGARPLPVESLHVTLCFIGSVDAERVGEIAAACHEVASGARAVRLAVSEPLWLPPRRPRVAAAGLHDDSGALAELQAALAAALVDGGWLAPEKRGFTPHVSVLRLRRGPRGRPPPLAAPPAQDFISARVTLYRSQTEREGTRYEAQAAVDLRPVR